MKDINSLSDVSKHLQLAEEAAELAVAAVKMARIMIDENPTPISKEEAERNLIEEYTDVVHCSKTCSIDWDVNILYKKRKRWSDRLNEQKRAAIPDDPTVNKG